MIPGEGNLPVDNLDEEAVSGPVVLRIRDWDARSEVLHGPTWLDVVRFANRALVRSGDFHRKFLAGLGHIRGDVADDGVPNHDVYMDY